MYKTRNNCRSIFLKENLLKWKGKKSGQRCSIVCGKWRNSRCRNKALLTRVKMVLPQGSWGGSWELQFCMEAKSPWSRAIIESVFPFAFQRIPQLIGTFEQWSDIKYSKRQLKDFLGQEKNQTSTIRHHILNLLSNHTLLEIHELFIGQKGRVTTFEKVASGGAHLWKAQLIASECSSRLTAVNQRTFGWDSSANSLWL